MFLLTRKGLQAVYPSHAYRFSGFLEVMEKGALMIAGEEVDWNVMVDIKHKVQGMLSDLMVLYFMIRACHGEMDFTPLHPSTLERMYDNLRISLYICYRLYACVYDACALLAVDVTLPAIPHHSREVDWLYDHYVMWRELMSESYGGDLTSLSVMRSNPLDVEDISSMCNSGDRLQRIMSASHIDGIPVRHLLRPVNYTTSVWPTVRRMVALELRMRMNDKGEMGETHIASWHHDSMYAVPPRAATFLLANRSGDHV